MPKVRRGKSPSNDNSTRSYPYPSRSNNGEVHKPTNLSGSVEDLKEWEEARCPICMEPPHNAVLLKCSSHEMGCRPYMCNTSYRHSNCVDQFFKSFAHQCETQVNPKVICPLCRGEVFGYLVLEHARRFMNSKPRSCSSETCEFEGTYSELRKHARSEHPSVHPSEVDPSRQDDWARMERERGLEDLFSSIHADSGVQYSGDTNMTGDLADMMSLFFYEIFSSIDEVNQRSNWLADSRRRMSLHDDRRTVTAIRTSDNTQTNRSARWRTRLPSSRQMNGNDQSIWRINLPLWRTNWLSSRSSHDLQYNGERSPRVWVSPTRMPQPPAQITQTNPSGNISSSGRTPRHRLLWRDHTWSTNNYQP